MHAWTLCYEMSFYAIVAAAMLLSRHAVQKRLTMLQIVHCCTIGCAAVQMVAPMWLRFPLDLFPQFGLGVLVYERLSKRTRSSVVLFALVVGMLAVNIFRWNVPVADGLYHSRPVNLGAVLIALFILLIAPWDLHLSRLLPIRLLSLIGGFSYSLYLFHPYAVGIQSQLLMRRKFFVENHYLTLALVTCAAIFAGQVSYYAVEKPFLKRRRHTKNDLPVLMGVVPPSDASTA